MTGHSEDEYGPEDFRPAPHPDDRLWRHPAEMAAMRAAHANAETAQVPVVTMPDPVPERSRNRASVGILLATGVVLGATAVTLGVVSTRDPVSSVSTQTPVTAEAVEAAPAAAPLSQPAIEPISQPEREGEQQLVDRIQTQVAPSLARIQASDGAAMREGSGMFVTESGHIATSAGLIQGATSVIAWTDDGRRWEAEVVAADALSDVAIVRINGQVITERWPVVTVRSEDPLVGQYAMALDHLSRSMTVGQVEDTAATLLAADAASSRIVLEDIVGPPGSAIIDDSGDVIAMANAASPDYGTPGWMLDRVITDLLHDGAATHTWFGVYLTTAPTSQMVEVKSVSPGSPAAVAGLQPGDLIDMIDQTTVSDAADLLSQVQTRAPGDEIELTVTRYGNRRMVYAILGERPADD